MINALIISLLTITFLTLLFFIFLNFKFKNKDAKVEQDVLHEEQSMNELSLEINNKLAILSKAIDDIKLQNVTSTTEIKILKENIKNQDNKIQTNQNKIIEEFHKNNSQLLLTKETLIKVSQEQENLNKIFLNNKHRGNVGEYVLEKLLEMNFGSSDKVWKKQHKLSNGKIIDAIVFSENGLNIGIDSKFPLDNYKHILESKDNNLICEYTKEFKKNVRSQIDQVAEYGSSKEISNLIMFIPSEEIFLFLLSKEMSDIFDYSSKKKILLISPTGFSHYLNIVDRQNRQLKMAKNLENIVDQIKKTFDDFRRWNQRWIDVKKSFEKVTEKIEDLDITQNKLDKKYDQIKKLDVQISYENNQLEKKDEFEL